MMKTNYLFIGMAALMIAACSNNENEPQVDDGRIAVSFAGEITLPRATTDTWEANDGIGIYMEKPLNFDPFGHARFAHLFVLYD